MNVHKLILPALLCLLSPGFRPSLNAEEASLDAQIARLIKELGSTDYEVSLKAQDALLDLAQQFYTKMAGGLASEDPETRQGTLSVLGKLDSVLRVSRIAAQIPEGQRAALRQLDRTDPRLCALLGNPDPLKRKKACSELAKLPPDLAVPVLAALAGDGNPVVRNHAVRGLGLTGNVQALPHLKKWVKSSDSIADANNPLQAAGLFNAIRINGMVDGNDTELEARPVNEVAVESIGMIKHADAAQFLIAGLDAHDGSSFESYLKALEETGQIDAAVAALLPKIDDTTKLDASVGGPGSAKVIIAQAFSNSSRIQPRTVGDAAFLSILRITGQTPESYGIVAPVANSNEHALVQGGNGMVVQGQIQIEVNSNGGEAIEINGQEPQPMFANEEARTRAIAKLKAWVQHSQKGASHEK